MQRSAATIDRTPSPTEPASDAATIATALRAKQLLMHGQNVPWAIGGTLLLTALFIGVQWRTIALGPLLTWLALLLLAMAWRGGLWARLRRATGKPASEARWLLHYRLNFLAHGLVWAAASALPLPADQPMHLAILVMMVVGMSTSNFVLHAFDFKAALLFGVPAMLALSCRLVLPGDPMQSLLAIAVLLALGIFTLIGRRASLNVRETIVLRLTEARQDHLLRLLIDTTSEGYWFIDEQACTVDANPAMCRMLGLAREALIGRSIYDFVDADNRRVFEREIARRAAGDASGYEVTLQRADGGTVDCFNKATPMIDEQGRRIGSIGLWTDITERKRAERALRDTSEALRSKSQALEDTMDSISQGIVSYDAEGRVHAHNQRMVDLLELPPALMQGDVRRSTVTEYLVKRGDLQPDQVLLDGSGQPLPRPLPVNHDALPDLYVRRTPAGLLIEVRTRHLADGGMVRTFADVTAYIEALRSAATREREQRELLEAFPGYIIVTDYAYRYSYVNQRFARLSGKSEEQIIGALAPEVLGPQRFAVVLSLLEQARQGGPVTVESEYPATSWRPHTFLQVTHAVSRDPVTGRERVVAFGIDISARKAAEAALVAARDEAERANRAKSQFLSGMSHELRTPLNAILGFGHLLANDKLHPLSEGQRRQTNEILRGARHLLQLINEVLDLAVVESGSPSVQMQRLALAPVLKDSLTLLQPLAASRAVTLPTQPAGAAGEATVQADPVRLKQVMLNLLGNAIKYNRLHGEVQVHVTEQACDDGDAGWRITVRDTGPGLSADQQSRLFGVFERVGAQTGRVEGSGLGLALSRGLVRAMGGEIGVHSQPGEGCSFWVQLRAASAEAAAPPVHDDAEPQPRAPARPAAAERPRVLYVEDNPINRMLMAAVFEQLPSMQLHMAVDAAQGLQMALDHPPQLVLLDIQLPDMDGHALLQRMRAHPSLAHVPIVALSADATPASIARGRAAGFNDYLTKPLDVQQLKDTLEATLGAD